MRLKLREFREFKKLIIIAVIATVAALSGIFVPTSAVFADDEAGNAPTAVEDRPPIWMQVSPVSNRVVLKAGNELTYTFSVENIGSQGFKFKVYTVPYTVVDEDYNVNFTEQTNRTQLSRWVTFRTTPVVKGEEAKELKYAEEAYFDIPAAKSTSDRSIVNIEYKVSVPENIPSGGQYAAIVTEYVPDENTAAGVQTIPRVNMVVYGSTSGDTVNLAEISEHEMPGFLTAGKINATSVVSNKGNTDFSAVYEFKVENFFGGTAFEKTYTYDVLPDTSRRINVSWDDTPIFGVFHVTNTIYAFDQTSVQSKLVLVIPIFAIIILIILLTALVVWIIILVKKRQARKSRIVV